ncbi:MAG: GntG family PLP-dependent aldolase [Crocinitomicaceae bacterium]|nr:aminotransferase class I/II-fold pyridoxal phosphate-dependent enzyme [Crocinitomicaceae bacterium]
MIDFRSDTVTKPSKEMREAMANAEVGDDVFGDDPTVNELERLGAEMFGHEAALFCTSGTQSNQIAINVWTNPGDEVICHEESHIYRYEGGGIALNSFSSARFLRGNSGRIDHKEILPNINPDDQHYPVTSLVSIEDTANRGGGVYYDFNEIKKISETCAQVNLPLHLDGARVFNALQENGANRLEYGAQFDSISICLSKGLGAPVGSILLGSQDFIKRARRVRKRMGGGMRQAGIIAAGAIYALKNNVDRLADDHRRAREVEKILASKSWIESVIPVQTNIVVGHLHPGVDENEIVAKIKEHGILCVGFGKGRIRFTTHLDISDQDINYLADKLPNEL